MGRKPTEKANPAANRKLLFKEVEKWYSKWTKHSEGKAKKHEEVSPGLES